ncbi:unnamed protein product [Sphagnum jensenii]|uniref:Uncharacterized protein n=1 Tax=Sphagnum jensenii TaxID=128206 RepID=A0ABP0XJL9_9BRYO
MTASIKLEIRVFSSDAPLFTDASTIAGTAAKLPPARVTITYQETQRIRCSRCSRIENPGHIEDAEDHQSSRFIPPSEHSTTRTSLDLRDLYPKYLI